MKAASTSLLILQPIMNLIYSIKIKIVFIAFALAFSSFSYGQVDSTKTLSRAARRSIVFSSQGLIVVGSLAYLQSTWYSQFQNGDFHVIDDSGQWLQMDKLGHVATVNILSNLNYKAYKWAGYNNTQASWMGFGISWGYLAAVEVLDGFSEGWGYSWSDMAANTLGGALFLAQQLTWEDQRIIMKFSYHQTDYADIRSEILGSTGSERILKDYNGQTYWLSVNPQAFSKNKKIFPTWLNLAIGYSADGMVGGRSNVGEGYDYSHIQRTRQFFFSPDIDLSRIKTKSKFLNTLFDVLNIIKIPAPTLDVDQNGTVHFYFFYF